MIFNFVSKLNCVKYLPVNFSVQVASLLYMASISFFLYKVVTFVQSTEGQSIPEHTPEELAEAALGVYVSQAYYLLVYLFLIVISVMMLVGVHAVSLCFVK